MAAQGVYHRLWKLVVTLVPHTDRGCAVCAIGGGEVEEQAHFICLSSFPKIETTVFNHCNSGTNYF